MQCHIFCILENLDVNISARIAHRPNTHHFVDSNLFMVVNKHDKHNRDLYMNKIYY